MDVSPLSRGMMSALASIPIRPITGQLSLLPSSCSRTFLAFLAVHLPSGGMYGISTFRLTDDVSGLGSAYPPAVLLSAYSQDYRGISDGSPFWPGPISAFGPFQIKDVYQQFTYVSHTTPASSPTA